MARQFLTPIDMSLLEIRNGVLHLLASDPGSPVAGQLYYNTTTNTVEFYNGTGFVSLGTLDQVQLAAADVNVNNHKITNLTTPTVSGDASTKGYVDGQTLNGIATRTASTADITASGFKITNVAAPGTGTDAVNKTYADALVSGVSSWKTAVRAATTANGTLATAYENGDTIDGVTLATGDRILLKNQTTGGENGIYTVAASGAPTRTTDSDVGTELVAAGVWVDEGTTQADSAWVNTTAGPITIGTTATVWVQFSGAGQITSGTGLTKTGNTLNVGAGTGILANADDVAIDTSVTVDKTTAQTLTNKTLTSPVVNTPTGIVKGDVGLGNVDNTSDANKPVSTATQAALDAHTTDATDAHDASAISILDTANDFTATDVEAALAELQTADEADEAALAAHLADTTAAHAASAIAFTPDGSIAATTVQAAIVEVRDEAASGAVQKFSVDCAAATSTVVTHNFGTLDVLVQVYVTGTTGGLVECDVEHTTTNTVTVTFAVAPSAAAYRITCIG